MPVFQIDIEKRIGGENWTNRYFTMAENIVQAVSVADDVLNAERAIHNTVVNFIQWRVSSVASNNADFITSPVNTTGQLNDSTNLLPLFNVLRVQFPVPLRRPHYKLYRGILTEALVNGSVFAATTGFSAAWVTFRNSVQDVVTTGLGVQLGTPTLDPQVRMRQLRRGTRRKSTTILPA